MKMDNLLEARENASDKVGIGFTSASNWLSRWREFFRQITEVEVKRNQSNLRSIWILNWIRVCSIKRDTCILIKC